MCRGATGLRVDWTEEDQKLGNVISVPSEIYDNGCVRDVDDGLAVSMIASFCPEILPVNQVFFANLCLMWRFSAGS